jgi:hypothetical protein
MIVLQRAPIVVLRGIALVDPASEQALTQVINYDEPDIDDLDMMDPHANPEELLLCIERFTGRGFWSAGTQYPLLPKDKRPLQSHHKKWRAQDNKRDRPLL